MSDLPYHLLDDEQELSVALDDLSRMNQIAVDTEFLRTNTYFAKPGLIQMAGSDANYLFDPVAITDFKGFGPILSSADIVKIMHSMSEDVELLYRATGARLQNVFDTQIAAAFLGYGMSLGYQKLVQEVLGIELDKSETRSDWLARPLSDSQLKYAALDVEYLLSLYELMHASLCEKGFDEAVREESERVVAQSYSTWGAPESAYLKLRGGCELNLQSQMLLQKLVMWRDDIALGRDIPKPWVFNDASLILIAEKKPKTPSELKKLKGMQFKSLKKHGESLLQIIEEFTPPPSESFITIDKPVRGRELDYYQKLKSMIARVSAETGIEKQLLGSRKMLEGLVIKVRRQRATELPEEYSGWRKPYLADEIIKILEV